MQRERVSDNVYWFQSDIYAQVTAGVVAGTRWAVLIDTLALPEETLAIRSFIEEELDIPVRYIINTHYHADHTWGNCFFPGATILASLACREAMAGIGLKALESAKKENPAFKQIKQVIPHITFREGKISLRVGKKTLTLSRSPGHSDDGISVLVEEDRVLFAGDAFLPVPYIVDGNIEDLINTIKGIERMGLENIIQGHGDIILRGEIENSIKQNINYLTTLRKLVRTAAKRKYPYEAIESIEIEKCGKSRVLLGGLGVDLHDRNVNALLSQELELAQKDKNKISEP